MVEKITNNDMSKALNAKVAVVDFSATWCGPCQMLAPVLDEVSEELVGKINFFKVDVDECNSLAAAYGITNIPALLVLKDGEKQEISHGRIPRISHFDGPGRPRRHPAARLRLCHRGADRPGRHAFGGALVRESQRKAHRGGHARLAKPVGSGFWAHHPLPPRKRVQCALRRTAGAECQRRQSHDLRSSGAV